jgi:hypothetical protein
MAQIPARMGAACNDYAPSGRGGEGMKVLSIRQPWAWLIVNGYKDIENRTWRFFHCGHLLIHAGKEWDDCYDPRHPEWFQRDIDEMVSSAPTGYYRPVLPPPDRIERGGIVGKVEVVGCVTRHGSPWFNGPFGIVVKNQKVLPFLPCQGRLGVFDLDYSDLLNHQECEAILNEGKKQ